jgi:glycosyltransferase involved in cell wall biosynthesis
MSELTPRVSVIIPAFNAERYIRQTLESIFAQTYPNVEVIVVDDGSTDRTRDEVAAVGARVTYIYQPNSGGCSKPRNVGMKAATGEFFAFLDSDDLLVPHRLATEVEILMRHPEVGLVFSNYQDFLGDQLMGEGHFETCPILSQRLAGEPLVLQSADSTDLLLTENFGSSSPMVRRTVAAAVGEYDETLRASEDYEFQYRVAARYPIAVIPQIGWHKRLHLASMSSNTTNILRHKILTRRRLLNGETVPARRRKLKQRLASLYWELAYYQTGRDNILALKHAFTCLRYRPQPSPKLFLRILLDALGRDTNGTRAPGLQGMSRSA